MKFQDSSFNGLKVTVGTKSVTHPRTHAPTNARSKSNMPHQLFQSWGHKNGIFEHLWIMVFTLDLENISWILIFTHLYLPRNSGKIEGRKNFPFYGSFFH